MKKKDQDIRDESEKKYPISIRGAVCNSSATLKEVVQSIEEPMDTDEFYH